MPVNVRERAPLRLHYLIETPSSGTFRWGQDEPKAENTPSGEKFGDSMPGGYDAFDARLPRKPHLTYQDLEPLSTIKVRGAGGEPAGEYRLERTPRESGDERSVSVQGVGWQAHLEDDKTASELYIGRDLGDWQGMSAQRKINAYAAGNDTLNDGTVEPDVSTGTAALTLYANGGVVDPMTESWLDAGAGLTVARILASYAYAGLSSSWTARAYVADDDIATNAVTDSDLATAASGSGTIDFTPSTARRWAAFQAFVSGTDGTDVDRYFKLTNVRVVGNHGLTLQGTAPNEGLYASDVIANAVSRWAPLLHYSTGTNGTIKPSAFVIPHLSFREPTTAAEILKEANRFHLRDWAVWDDRTFYYNERGDGARTWRARVGPSELEETGPAVDRIWNGVIVQFRDVDGTTKTVGPTGSAASSTSSDLIDTDTENPANKLGIRRWTMIDMGIVSTTAAATEVGRRFLVESKAIDSSGKAQLVGHVEDSKGILRPYWQVRSGDYISFVDAADTNPRRIVKTEKDVSSRTCSVDLDAPPDALDALLERLGVVLVPLGL